MVVGVADKAEGLPRDSDAGGRVCVSFWVSAQGLAELDGWRGMIPRSAYIRALLGAEARARSRGGSLVETEAAPR